MIRAATPNGILNVIGWLLSSLLIGALAGRIAKYSARRWRCGFWPSSP